MKVLKFGGSSVGSTEIINVVKNIIQKQENPAVVVVSAFRGVTDQLINLSTMAASKDDAYTTELTQLRTRHLNTVNELVEESLKVETIDTVTHFLDELEDILRGLYLLNEITPKIYDYILSFGERLSAYIISQSIEGAINIDCRELIKTDSRFGNARVDFEKTNELIRQYFANVKGLVIAPGFIASNNKGETTTLGRGGSDYTASIFAAALNAEGLEIWTDVDGFMTADPRKVDKAFAIKHLSYAEAMELSHFGAKVIYTPTIQPALTEKIEIRIKNTFNPDAVGTLISADGGNGSQRMIKGISSIDNVDLITLQGAGMVGVQGTSSKLFSALAEQNINIILITQASSEFSITFAVNPHDTELALEAIRKKFETEIALRHEVNILVERDLSVIAIVGEKMKNTPGISANLFTSLGRNGISVIATAQGSSELNISVVIKRDSLKKALNVIHEGFFLSHYKELHLFVIGVGNVGSNLLEQIRNQQCKLQAQSRLKINVVGIANSRKMHIDPEGIDLDKYPALLEGATEKTNMDVLHKRITDLNLRNSVFVDCTANDAMAQSYQPMLNSFISVVTANKVACSSEYSLYESLKKTAVHRNVKFMFETNVGAGLPVINTINDLIRSGDKILRLEAVLSGTLNFIFNELSADIPMSKAILMAKEKGFSEPDPRIDLSGIDVVRKIIILAREAGYQIEQSDVTINKFLPDGCFEGSMDDFWEKVKSYDADFEERRKALVKQHKKWRFVALLNEGKASVGLEEVDSSHPSYPLEGSNNIVLLTTERYNEAPMVIRGYGAGADVTAAGVFADIMRVANI